jgi:hypothetical protein
LPNDYIIVHLDAVLAGLASVPGPVDSIGRAQVLFVPEKKEWDVLAHLLVNLLCLFAGAVVYYNEPVIAVSKVHRPGQRPECGEGELGTLVFLGIIRRHRN